jgi:hypothetical protein
MNLQAQTKTQNRFSATLATPAIRRVRSASDDQPEEIDYVHH